MSRTSDQQTAPVARLVLLGASNLRLYLPVVVRIARATLGGPLEVLVAHGHGRSYGEVSSIPGRTLPGIAECHLWRDLTCRPNLPTFALLTDIGNDLLFDVEAAQLLDWVEDCVRQLRTHEAKISLTDLPKVTISTKSLVQFKIFRTIFFPACRLSFAEVLERAKSTREGLLSLSKHHECVFQTMKEEWYGIDPIHIRRSKRQSAYEAILAPLLGGESESHTRIFAVKNRLALELAVPYRRRLFGFTQRRSQPSIRLHDGTTIAIY